MESYCESHLGAASIRICVSIDVFRANTRQEMQKCETSADCVTLSFSGSMTDWSALPDMDVFGLPIP